MNGSEIQVEKGNYTRIHNAILEALASTNFSGRELRCLLHLLRMTYGFNRKAASISLAEWSKATDIRRGHVNETLNGLVERNVIFKTTGNASAAGIWEFNKYTETWRASTPSGTGFTSPPVGTGTSTQEGTGTSTPLMSTTEDTKDNIKDNYKDTTSDDVPTAPQTAPSLVEQFRLLNDELKTTKNRQGVLRRIYALCFGEAAAPDYGYLGRVATQVGGAGRLAQLMFELVTRPPAGDILAYIVAEENGRKKRAQLNGKPTTEQVWVFNPGGDE